MVTTNFKVPEEVKNEFAEARTKGDVRWIKIVIEGEEIKKAATCQKTENEKEDFNGMAATLGEKDCAFFLYHISKGENTNSDTEWLIIWYIDDKCKVKQRMVYASTIGTLKTQLGSHFFIGEQHTSTKEELSYEKFEFKHDEVVDTAMYMTKEEKEVSSIESTTSHMSGAGSSVKGVAFPVADDVPETLKGLVEGEHAMVALAIEEEQIRVADKAANAKDAFQAIANAPEKEPRFYLITYQEKNLLIYACPEKSKVKARMVYSASKKNILAIANQANYRVQGTFEYGDHKEVTQEEVNNKLNPQEQEEKVIVKPVRKNQRGKRKPPKITAL